MKRLPKRFSSRVDLLVAIEDCQHRIKMAMKLGEGHNKEADKFRDKIIELRLPMDGSETEEQRVQYHSLSTKMRHHREKADEKIRSLPRRHKDLERLTAALAEFDTQPMPFLEDASVQV